MYKINKKITVGGQSAGAASTTMHLLSKKSKGMFHRAIIESNPLTLPMKTPVSLSFVKLRQLLTLLDLGLLLL
jgi:carboxylesterase type B